MRKFKKNIYKITLLLLASGVLSGGEFFHHHESLQSESRCQACLFNHTLSAGDPAAESTTCNLFIFENLLPSLEFQVPETRIPGSFSSRAPPFSS